MMRFPRMTAAFISLMIGIGPFSPGQSAWHPSAAIAQAAPPISGLLALVPSRASAVTIRQITLNGDPYASIGWDTDSSSSGVPFKRLNDSIDNSYSIYAWDGQKWQQTLDVTGLAQQMCQSPSIGGTNTNPCVGQLVDLFDLSAGSSGQSTMPDLLGLELSFSFPSGPATFPVFLIIGEGGQGLTVLDTLKFNVRGIVDSALRFQNSIVVEADAYGANDGACCPGSYQYVVLGWAGSGLTPAVHEASERSAVLLASRPARWA